MPDATPERVVRRGRTSTLETRWLLSSPPVGRFNNPFNLGAAEQWYTPAPS